MVHDGDSNVLQMCGNDYWDANESSRCRCSDLDLSGDRIATHY